MVKNTGGFVATCPINWGWTADGDISLSGLYYGLKAFSDILLGNKLDRIPGAKRLLHTTGIKGFSSFHTKRWIYSNEMQNFMMDLFHQRKILDSSIFNKKRLGKFCANDIMNESRYEDLTLILDLALAVENFNASI